jgi:hypothetical protein
MFHVVELKWIIQIQRTGKMHNDLARGKSEIRVRETRVRKAVTDGTSDAQEVPNNNV